MKKRNIFTAFLILAAGLILAFSSDYNSAGMQYGAQNENGVSLAKASGISSKGNAAGVYEFKNKSVPTAQATTESTQTAAQNAGEVVVTARRIPEDIALVPREVEVIKAADIADAGDKKLQDVLDSVAGSMVLVNGGYQGAGSVSMRGAPSKQTLLLLDGVPVNDIMTGGADLNLIDLTNIEKIEIVKGGLSSVYGANAASGVINVISGSKEDKPITASAEYGSFNFQKYSLASDYKVFGVRYSVSAIEEKSDGYVQNSAYLKHAVNAKLSFTGDALDSTVYGYYFNRQMNIPYNGMALPAYKETDAKQWDENFNIGADEKFSIGSVKAKLSGYMRSAQLQYMDQSSASYSNHKKKEYSGSFFIIYDEGGFLSGMTGYDVNFKEVNSTDIGNTTNSNTASVTNMSAKLFDDKLIINAGFRADFNSAYNNMTSENISVKYKFPENVDIRMSVDKSFSAPTLCDLTWPTQDCGYSYYMKGNSSLKPENSTAFEAGIAKKDSKMTESITFFKSEIVNLISWKEITDGVSVTDTPINIDRAFITGIEVKADFKPADFLVVNAGYTYLRALDNDNKQLPYRPEGLVEASVTIKFPSDTKLIVNGQYVDFRKDTGGNTLKPYSIMNCTAVQTLSKNVKLTVEVKNALNNTTYQVVKNYPMPGRVFNAGVQVSF